MTIPDKIRSELEKTRADQHKALPEHLALTWEYNAAWMAGAEAAYRLATQTERERCAQLASTFKHTSSDPNERRKFAQLQNEIVKGLNPTTGDG